VVHLNNVNATDELLHDAVAQPVVRKLAEVIDREFTRSEPELVSHYDWAAATLGISRADLVVLTSEVPPVVGRSVGWWLLETHREHGGPLTGSRPDLAPASEPIDAAAGDAYALRTAMLRVPGATLHVAPVVVRLATSHFDVTVEVMAPKAHADGLSEAFSAFLHHRRTTGSPFRGGCYRVDVVNGELDLTRWTPPAASRSLLKLDDSLWTTVDRSVHRVIALADDLEARGLGTSSGVLLVGPPGTGKTQLGMVLAGELQGRATVLVPGGPVVAHFLTDLFDLAGWLSPSLVLMDDLDLIAGERGTMNPHALREFLNVMDGGLADRSGVVVVASTNDHKKVDKAAQRASRFDTVIKMEAPSYAGRLAILERYLAWCEAPVDREAVARATDGATGADLKEVVRQAVLDTVDDITTEALLAAAQRGRWQRADGAGVYL